MLLLDENISHRVIKHLEATFPGSKHIIDFLSYGSPDESIWVTALENKLTIVSFDADYQDMLILRGFPPKVIWFRFGNCSNKTIINTLLFYQ